LTVYFVRRTDRHRLVLDTWALQLVAMLLWRSTFRLPTLSDHFTRWE
jgi:hypothetical protein